MPNDGKSQATTVDLTSFRLEPHVRDSFFAAWVLADGGPVDDALAIRAAEETVRKLRERGEALVAGWSTGLRRGNVAVGDRVFLIRQAREPRGLVGAGWVQTEPRELPHWDKDKREAKRTYHQVQVLWDDLRTEPLLALPELLKRFGRASLWSSRGGAVAGKGAPIQAGSTSVQRAAQIEFNAWHYVDSDLWASLASHIFDGLSEELRGPRDESGEVRRRLRRAIHSSRNGRRR